MIRNIVLAATLAGISHQAALTCRDNSKLPDLTFRDDGKFQIAIFSDFHLAECM